MLTPRFRCGGVLRPHNKKLNKPGSQRSLSAAKRFLAPVVITLVLAAIAAGGVLEPVNIALMDLRFRLIERAPSETLVVVEIDPKSLREEARWPWPRDRYGKVVANLQNAGASLIALDVDFSSLSDEAGDAAFAEALSRRPGEVVLPVFWQWSSRAAADGAMIKTPPNPKFLEDAVVASVTLTAEKNGVVRRGWRGVHDGDVFRMSIASVLAMTPGNESETFYIDYSIDPERIERLSFHDALAGNFPVETVRGKNILIGATALELGDEFAAPIYGVTSGVMFHALSYESLVSDRTIVRPHPGIPLTISTLMIMWLVMRSPSWSWRKLAAMHVGVLAVAIGTPILLQAFYPVSFDAGSILAAQFLCLVYVIGARIHRYARQVINQRAAMARYQALTAMVVRDNTDGVIVADRDGRVELCNARARALLCIDEGVPRGARIENFVADFPLYNGEATEQGEQSRLCEYVAPGAPDTTLEVVASCLVHQDKELDAGEARAHIIYTLRDISARKRMEEAEREAKEAAIVANNVKTQLIANMSHELRTPLNGVIGFADIMQKESFGPHGVADYKEYSESIYVSGKRLLGLVNDMLNIAKLDAGEYALNKNEAMIDEIIESGLYKFESQATAEKKSLTVDVKREMPAVTCDIGVLNEILSHLLSNAMKYTNEGGAIVVRALENDGDLIIEVEDNGCGVSPEALPRLTDAFYQVDGAFNRKHEGAGLGLYVVSKFVELHDGALVLETPATGGFLACILFRNAIVKKAREKAA